MFNESNTYKHKWFLIYCDIVFFALTQNGLRQEYVIHLAYIIILVRCNGMGQLFRYFIIKAWSLMRALDVTIYMVLRNQLVLSDLREDYSYSDVCYILKLKK